MGKTRYSALRRESDRGQGLLEDGMVHMFLSEDAMSKQNALRDLLVKVELRFGTEGVQRPLTSLWCCAGN